MKSPTNCSTPFPGLFRFTLDPYLIMLSIKQDGMFSMTRPGIEPRSPGPLANTLLIRPMARLNLIKKYLNWTFIFQW